MIVTVFLHVLLAIPILESFIESGTVSQSFADLVLSNFFGLPPFLNYVFSLFLSSPSVSSFRLNLTLLSVTLVYLVILCLR